MSLVRAARPAITAADVDRYREAPRWVRGGRGLARWAFRQFTGWWPVTFPATLALVALVILPGWLGWVLLVLAIALGVLLVRTSMEDAARVRQRYYYRKFIEGDESHVGLAVGWGLFSERTHEVARVIFTEDVPGGVDITLRMPTGVDAEALDPLLAARDLGARFGEVREAEGGAPDEVILSAITEDATRADHAADFLDPVAGDDGPLGQGDGLDASDAALHEGAAWWETAEGLPSADDREEEA